MILLTIGTSGIDFRRLLQAVDEAVDKGLISDVVAQIGYTNYRPRNLETHAFISRATLGKYIRRADFVISHGGEATLDQCLAMHKKVIVMPRRAKYGEHVDDHQLEIVEHLEVRNRILVAREVDELAAKLMQVRNWTPTFLNQANARKTLVRAIHHCLAEFSVGS